MGAYYNTDATVSARGAVVVVPDDSTVIEVTRALYIGGTGDVTVTMANGVDATFVAAPVGILPVQVTKVLSTGTAATSILALY